MRLVAPECSRSPGLDQVFRIRFPSELVIVMGLIENRVIQEIGVP